MNNRHLTKIRTIISSNKKIDNFPHLANVLLKSIKTSKTPDGVMVVSGCAAFLLNLGMYGTF